LHLRKKLKMAREEYLDLWCKYDNSLVSF
jgi:hypothetical protein